MSHPTLKLFSPFILGGITLRHRVVMAPLTRLRSDQPGDIPGDGIVNLYREAALKARIAGFDGVEVLAAGGYLLDQFLQNGTNLRTDAYGGSVENRVKGGQTLHAGHPPVAAAGLRKIFKGPIIAAGGFDREGAIKIVENGDADLVAFGRQFISNPDLPERLRLGIPLNPYNRPTFYSGGPEGYIDYLSHSSDTIK